MAEELDPETCVTCDEALDGMHQTSCQICGGKFHQPWTQDSGVPQCGTIASHVEALAIVFVCNDCYRRLGP